jgi:hypothetical protein
LRLRWHEIRQVDPSMGTGFDRQSPRPLVLRHAYQSKTRRYTPRCPERTHLFRIVTENLEALLQTAREQNESGLGLPKYVELTAIAYDVYRKFATWIKEKGLMRLGPGFRRC